MKKKYLVFGFLVSALLLWGITINGDLNILGTLTATVVDFTSSTSTAPMKSGTTLPATCTVGQAFFKTDATAGQNIYLCTSGNTWTQVQSGGGGSFNWKPSSRYVVAWTDFASTMQSQSPPISLGAFSFLRISGSQALNAVWSPAPPSTRGGYAQITTTTTENNRSYWYLAIHNNSAPSVSDSLFANTTLNWEIVVVFRLPSTSDTSNVEVQVGFGAASSGDPPSGVWLAYRPLVTGTNFYWQVTSEGLWNENADTGVAADTEWHRVKIRSDGAAANKVWLRLDNGTEISACPSGCTITRNTYLSENWNIIGFNLKTKEAIQKKLQLDYVHFWLDLGVER